MNRVAVGVVVEGIVIVATVATHGALFLIFVCTRVYVCVFTTVCSGRSWGGEGVHLLSAFLKIRVGEKMFVGPVQD